MSILIVILLTVIVMLKVNNIDLWSFFSLFVIYSWQDTLFRKRFSAIKSIFHLTQKRLMSLPYFFLYFLLQQRILINWLYILVMSHTRFRVNPHYSCLNVQELLARSRRKIWSLSDCNRTRTHKHLVHKQTLKLLAKLVGPGQSHAGVPGKFDFYWLIIYSFFR